MAEPSCTFESHRDFRGLEPVLRRAVLDVWPYYDDNRFEVRFRIPSTLSAWGHYERAYKGKPAKILIAPRVVREGGHGLRGVIAHELAHHQQFSTDRWPQGEKAADLIWLATCGAAFPPVTLYIQIPFVQYAKGDRYAAALQHLAIRAWDCRRAGVRKYIQWFEEKASEELGSTEEPVASWLPGEPRETPRIALEDRAVDLTGLPLPLDAYA